MRGRAVIVLVIIIAAVTSPVAASFAAARRALMAQRALLPLLYGTGAAVNIEHVVPASLLRRLPPGAAAERDSRNWHVAPRSLNTLRSNYRFTSAEPGMLEVGGVRVSHARRVFCPRDEDWGPIARAILHCHRAYGIDPAAVLVGGSVHALLRLADEHPPTPEERAHAALTAELEGESDHRRRRFYRS